MSDAENFQQFQTHMLAFFGHMFNTVKVVVQSIPAAGSAGHLLQMAEASLNAAKVAAEETWKANEAPAEPAPAPDPVVDPAPAPLPADLPTTLEGLAQLVSDPAADGAQKAKAVAQMHQLLANAAVPSPDDVWVEKPSAFPVTTEEAPATDVGVPPAANPISDYPNPDHSQP